MSETPSGEELDGYKIMEELRNPENFEFARTPNGDKIHIVATGLSTKSMLLRGMQASGEAREVDQKALCGHVCEFETGVEPPEDVNEVLQEVCTLCNRQSGYIRNRGKFAEVPL